MTSHGKKAKKLDARRSNPSAYKDTQAQSIPAFVQAGLKSEA